VLKQPSELIILSILKNNLHSWERIIQFLEYMVKWTSGEKWPLHSSTFSSRWKLAESEINQNTTSLGEFLRILQSMPCPV